MNSKAVPVALLAKSAQWVLLALALAAPSLPAATFWTGANITYVQPAPGDADVLIPGVVSLARGANGPLYNAAKETTFDGVSSPKDTMWASGSLSNALTLHYVTFASLRGAPAGFDLSSVLLRTNWVVHLTNEDIYVAVTFLTWVHGFHPGVSGFSYTRSTPPVVAPPPSVTITNPPGGAVFAAPANVKIAANATVSAGSVTNVAFFGNSSNLLGSATSPPFAITASSLVAGSYSLTAVATAAGISATSSVVQVSVVSPVDIVLSPPAIAGGLFTFDYTVNPRLTYVLEKSSNFVDWSSSTNTPTVSPVHVSDSVVPDSWRFYRVRRLPNP